MNIVITKLSEKTIAALMSDKIGEGIRSTLSIPVRVVIADVVIGATICSITRGEGTIIIDALTESIGTTDSYQTARELIEAEFEGDGE